ncbi:MAG: Malonyl CoA-acyl carrier protein transacylase [Rhodocyclaceae bacterium]|jgi:[acyl-carrier-protein] S-malonyltransferase|nr:Malonyl CoA-acyl carrier protein transacylase [Rhodocyclaceae bacterium]
MNQQIKLAMVFPGQGSQSTAMMRAYGDGVAPALVRATFVEASEALGRDLWALSEEGSEEELSRTVNTQPIMLAAGVAVYRLWRDMGGVEPQLLAGHSLGEFSALVVADVLRFGDAIRLVERRGQAMQQAVPAGVGAMAALLGLDLDGVEAVCAEAAQGQVVSPANLNAPGQTVIAGQAEAVRRAVELARPRGAKKAVLLPVSAPFHCALMAPAATTLRGLIAGVQLSPPRIPVVNNVDVMMENEPERIRDALVRQVCAPVRWIEVVQTLVRAGATHVVECGPGKVLGALTKRIDAGVIGMTLSDRAALSKLRTELGVS